MKPIQSYGAIGDGHTVALVSANGELDWWCAPGFDSEPVFDALLGGPRRGRTSDLGVEASFGYDRDTNVLHARSDAAEAWWFMPYPRRSASEIICIERRGDATSAHRIDDRGSLGAFDPGQAEAALDGTRDAWRQWIGVDLPPRVARSLLALKLLTHEPTGAIVAAPTASLPEVPGGVRNWDYRYAWIRDTAFCAIAYARWGKRREAMRLAMWLLDRIVPRQKVSVLYRVDGTSAPDERETDLPGYAMSRPVRFGNGAIRQFQLDAYGHIIETLDVCHALDRGPLERAWSEVRTLVDHVIVRWREPDNGIWEIPAGARHHTYSKVMAWLAVDRAIRMAITHGFDAPLDVWARERDAIVQDVLRHGIDPESGAFRQAYGVDAADASTLRIPLVGFVEQASEVSQATLARVLDELAGPGKMVRRYRTPDGLPGEEGAFIACSFWLAELQAGVGDEEQARMTFSAIERLGGGLGLFSEEADPLDGKLLGNYPQAISHATHLCAAHAIGLMPLHPKKEIQT